MHLGLTTIMIGSSRVVISHTGNMGNTVEKSVEPNVDVMLGTGKLDKLLRLGTITGSPDYMWTLTIARMDFNKIVA